MKQLKTIRDILEESADAYQNRSSFIVEHTKDEFRSISYREFKKDVDALALALKEKLGLGGKHIAIMSKNSYRWCVAYFAILSGVGIAVPIDRDNSGEETVGFLDFGEVQAVICDRHSAVQLSENMGERKIPLICTEDDEGDGMLSFDSLLEYGYSLLNQGKTVECDIDPDKMAVLLFTSGTTGVSKGVMLSNSNIVSDLKAVSHNVKITYEDRSLSVLPLHHTYEAIAMLMVIRQGGTVCFASGFKNLPRDFKVYRPTVLVCVPLLLEKFNRRIEREIQKQGKSGKSKLFSLVSGVVSEESKRKTFASVHESFGGRLRKIIVGAAAIQKATADAFEMYGFTVIIGYGLTECSPIVICNGDLDRKSDSIGKPLNTAQVKILEPDSKGIGEIAVKGPMVMLGYYKNPQATEAVFKGDWFCTGDLGYADKEGYYHITGRKKNLIVTSGGKNIYPEELEYYILKSPLVSECIVYAKKDKEIIAEIFPDQAELKLKSKKDRLSDDEVELYIGAVVKTVNRKLPPYKRIKDFIIRKESFEKTTTHKIKR